MSTFWSEDNYRAYKVLFRFSHFLSPSPLWAEDSIWDIHQPPAGQSPCRDRWPWEDRGQCDGWPDHGGWPGWPWLPPPQDAVLPVHQSGSQRAKREGHWMDCPRTEELRGGRHKTSHAKLALCCVFFFFFSYPMLRFLLTLTVPPGIHRPWW